MAIKQNVSMKQLVKTSAAAALSVRAGMWRNILRRKPPHGQGRAVMKS